MDGELKNIDLIDKHLNENLTKEEAEIFQKKLAEDPDFAREVEVYQQLYKGIEARGDAGLKKRLGSYYTQYQVEIPPKPKGLQRRLIIIGSSIAASLILGTFFILFHKPDQTEQLGSKGGNTIETDSLQRDDSIAEPSPGKLAQDEDEADSRVQQQFEDSGLAVGGLKTIPGESVRIAQYPSDLQYTFDGREIVLFGDPLMASLRLQVVQNEQGQYFLKYVNTYYSINRTASIRPLPVVSVNYRELEPTRRQIAVKIEDITKSSQPNKNLLATYTGDKVRVLSYYFKTKDQITQLIINGTVNPDEVQVYVIQEGSDLHYFLRQDKKLFLLNPKATNPTHLQEVPLLSNEQTRLFRDRESVLKQVYLVK